MGKKYGQIVVKSLAQKNTAWSRIAGSLFSVSKIMKHREEKNRNKSAQGFYSWSIMPSIGSSTRKSASTWDLPQVLVRYSISYSLSSTAHFANLPDWLGWCKIIWSGNLVRTTIACDWKQNLNFRDNITTASANFSISGYRILVSVKVLLSSSLNRTSLMTVADPALYKHKGSTSTYLRELGCG